LGVAGKRAEEPLLRRLGGSPIVEGNQAGHRVGRLAIGMIGERHGERLDAGKPGERGDLGKLDLSRRRRRRRGCLLCGRSNTSAGLRASALVCGRLLVPVNVLTCADVPSSADVLVCADVVWCADVRSRPDVLLTRANMLLCRGVVLCAHDRLPHVLLRNVLLDNVLLRHVLLRHVLLRHVLLRHVLLRHVLLRHVLLRHARLRRLRDERRLSRN
jgi:hypothetical protein